jgi:acetyl-CoA acyltransferase
MPIIGRDVVIVEAARTALGRGHPEKGVFRELHPNALLGAVYEAAPCWAGASKIDP